MGDLLKVFRGRMRVRTKCSVKACGDLWGQSSILEKPVWVVTDGIRARPSPVDVAIPIKWFGDEPRRKVVGL